VRGRNGIRHGGGGWYLGYGVHTVRPRRWEYDVRGRYPQPLTCSVSPVEPRDDVHAHAATLLIFPMQTDFPYSRVRSVNITSGAVRTLTGSYAAPHGVALDSASTFALVVGGQRRAVQGCQEGRGVVVRGAGAAVIGMLFCCWWCSAMGQRDPLPPRPALLATPALTPRANALAVLQNEQNGHVIKSINLTSGAITLVAGRQGVGNFSDGIGTLATFYFPLGVAMNAAGTYAIVVSGWSGGGTRRRERRAVEQDACEERGSRGRALGSKGCSSLACQHTRMACAFCNSTAARFRLRTVADPIRCLPLCHTGGQVESPHSRD
jgi:hypothetical protein